jgi:hypothetical protein
VAPLRDLLQKFRRRGSNPFSIGQLLEELSHRRGEKRFSFFPGPSETTLKMWAVAGGTWTKAPGGHRACPSGRNIK